MEDKLTEKIYVDEEAEKLILFTFKQYKAVAILWTLISVITTIFLSASIIKHRNHHFSNWVETFDFKIYPYLYFVVVLLNLALLFYYYNAIKCQTKAMSESNQVEFSKSFSLYKKGNYVSIASLFVNLFTQSIFLYQQLQA
ncbi:MAG: hypothetical protein IPP96_03780 [Chitinophagaceae bacterium]|nr:hypothetical protein [Chitinophagaceae bacterium]